MAGHLDTVTNDVNYFPDGDPNCPSNGVYTMDATTHRVTAVSTATNQETKAITGCKRQKGIACIQRNRLGGSFLLAHCEFAL